MPEPRLNVALVGECMLELQGRAFGTLQQSYGGDTYNTAVYLARCGRAAGIRALYASAVGDDALSGALVEHWRADGVDTSLVRRVAGRMPGLYQIELDARGERRFSYWRDSSAAKAYFDADTTPLEQGAASWQALYLSGITLAILPQAGRERLFALMQAMRAHGAVVAFDNNYRARLWRDSQEARVCFERAFAAATLAFVTADDHQALLNLPDEAAALAAARALPTPELVIKRGAAPTLVHADGAPWIEVPTQGVARVVDTTAAGDSFAAGYLSRRLAGAGGEASALFGNRLAARVIQHPGAVIAADAMADLIAAG